MRGPEFLPAGSNCPTDPTAVELAEAYLAYFASEPRPPGRLWAYELMSELVGDRPEEAWEVIPHLVVLSATDRELAIVAAGPLEDLLCGHGTTVLDRVRVLATVDPRFRRCLSGVWGSNRMDPDVRHAVDELVRDEQPL